MASHAFLISVPFTNRRATSMSRPLDFSRVRELVPMSAVLELLRWKPLFIIGGQQRGGCPVHGSHSRTSRTFSVNTHLGLFQCFKCRAKGNQLDLWAQVHSLSVLEAAHELCILEGIAPPYLIGGKRHV